MNSNWSYCPETVKLGVDLFDLDFWPLTLTICMNINFVNGKNSWKCHDDKMTETLWKRCNRRRDRQTDGRTDRCVLRAAWSQLKNATDPNVFWNILTKTLLFPLPMIKLYLQKHILWCSSLIINLADDSALPANHVHKDSDVLNESLIYFHIPSGTCLM